MAQKRLLIVEDERIIAEDIKRTLLQFDYEVIDIISYGERVLERYEELNPNLILMDIMLAGKMNGIETASKIKDKHNVPIIYLTAYANEPILNSAKVTEPFGYLIKPFEVWSALRLFSLFFLLACGHFCYGIAPNLSMKSSAVKTVKSLETKSFTFRVMMKSKF